MRTKLFKVSKRIVIISLISIFGIVGIVACGGSSGITGSDSDFIQTTDVPDTEITKQLNSDLPNWGLEYKVELKKPEPESASYYVIRYSSGSKLDKASMLYIARTDNLQIYVEEGYSYNKEYIIYVASKFENNYKQMTNIYGTHTDVDNNGKIKLLFININGNNRNNVMVAGYFFPNDLIYGSANNGEILYMDINLLNSNPQDIGATVLHEFQHLINFNVNYVRKGRRMSLWLDESLAESTAVLFDNVSLQWRIREFNNIDYYCFYTWNLPSPYGDYFINYPSASMFMNWLYIKNGRNADIFKRIASSSQTQDYNKVLYAVSGNNWGNLLTDWINGVKNGAVRGAYIRSRSSATLYPGALIYDGSKIHVNPSTELANPLSYAITVSKENSISGRSAINNDEEEISLQNTENNQKTKYIDLVFDVDGKIREY